MIFIFTIIFLIILSLIAIVINNHLVAKKNKYLEAYGTVDIYLKKRFDLIPNLITIAKQYLDHEKELLTKVSELRSGIGKEIQDTYAQSEKLSRLWSSLQLTEERYPDLASNEQFLYLQKTLSTLENQISAARRAYNATVNSYNNTISMFPTNIIASLRGFKQQDLLTLQFDE